MILNFFLELIAGPNIDKKCIWLMGTTSSHKILRKFYFVVKPFKIDLNRQC